MINDREFLGLKFLIPGFFWVGKFGEYFLGWIDLSRDFLGIQNNLKIRGRVVLQIQYNQTCPWKFVIGFFGG